MKQDQGPKYLEYQIEKAQGTWSQAIAEPFFHAFLLSIMMS